MITRRHILALMGAAAMAPAARAETMSATEPGLQLGDSVPFAPGDVIRRAREMASRPHAPRPMVPDAWLNLTYDQYRKIWFDTRNALWTGTDRPQRLDVFAPGLYFPQPVEIFAVENGAARALDFDMGVFDKSDRFPEMPVDDSLGYSGLRLRAELQTPGKYTEYAVFQGASYFRGIGTGQTYGLSARGLALKTGHPMGEEFPDFTAFWIEAPEPGADQTVIHALLDSPSVAGAYRFVLRHGPALGMEVEATLFPRSDLHHVGIAPLTSMFLFDQTFRHRFDDFRPAVHDSDGLLIHNGAGEVIWRPLANPARLQISAFADRDPHGFGLMQRARDFADFADLEALYHNRPCAWITPGEPWGRGAVELVEIPADKEIYDNIVAYWRPADVIPAGAEHRLSYRLDWGAPEDVAPRTPLLRVLDSAAGGRMEGGIVFAIDFAPGPGLPEDLQKVERLVRSSAGEVTEGILQRNPETGGPRLAFTFDPGDATLAEFRVQLRSGGEPLSEVWLYRWTAA